MSGRGSYTLIGLVHPRSPWPSELSRWATSGAAPIEFLACLRPEEVRALLGAGRVAAAVLLDGDLATVDRDLAAEIRAAGAAVIGVDGLRGAPEWDAMGCDGVLPSDFDRTGLLEVLAATARPAGVQTRRVAARRLHTTADAGMLVAVTGSGGTGASTVAMAVAQALAAPPAGRRGRRARAVGVVNASVALVDGARRSSLAMYHDLDAVTPGLVELTDAFRRGTVDPVEVRTMLHPVEARSYSVLPGLRRSGDWSAVGPAAFGAALDGLVHAFDVVVVDHDADLDGDAAMGARAVAERHAVALTVVDRADVVVAVGLPGLAGTHRLAWLLDELLAAGCPADRIVPVVNRAPRSPMDRTEISRALARLATDRGDGQDGLVRATFVAEARLEALHRDAAALPESLGRAVADVTRDRILSAGRRTRTPSQARPLRPGETGSSAGSTELDPDAEEVTV